ncbi:MAG: hypothetical protein IJ859_01155 [Synergistaceae bacterium]|nr:hypothetical protein [Synergistaceae bacterium]
MKKLQIQSSNFEFNSSLREKLTAWIESNDGDITGTFRFFFKTNRKGFYIVETLSYPAEEIVYYIAAENAVAIKRSLKNELKNSLSLLYNDFDFRLTKESSFLDNPDITLDNCLKIFIDDIKERITFGEITASDIESLKAQISES